MKKRKTKSYVLLTEKNWHKDLFYNLSTRNPLCSWRIVNSKSDFNIDILNEIKPDKIFIPHWSYIIPKEIYEKFECVVFHMTDLPYGRGGSPLQNLIVRGLKTTKISALKVGEGVDTGDIYLKKDLSLTGTAQEIFLIASEVIEKMIQEIIEKDLKPFPQQGEVVSFKRRKPEQSNVADLISLESIYDYIRMLDCEGYPKAFLETEGFKFEFDNAKLLEKEIIANVRIFKK